MKNYNKKNIKKKYNEIIDYLYDYELESRPYFGARERAQSQDSFLKMAKVLFALPLFLFVIMNLPKVTSSKLFMLLAVAVLLLMTISFALYAARWFCDITPSSGVSRNDIKRKYYHSGLSTNKYIRNIAKIDTFYYEGPDNEPIKVEYAGMDITEDYKKCNNVLEQLDLIESLTVKL